MTNTMLRNCLLKELFKLCLLELLNENLQKHQVVTNIPSLSKLSSWYKNRRGGGDIHNTKKYKTGIQ